MMLESDLSPLNVNIDAFEDDDDDEEDDIRIPLMDEALLLNNIDTSRRSQRTRISNNNNNNNPQQRRIDPAQLEQWRENERRQRTIRILIMFLLMLLVMDGDHDEQVARQRAKQSGSSLRGSANNQGTSTTSSLSSSRRDRRLEPVVFSARQRQDETIRTIVERHFRYLALARKNHDDLHVDTRLHVDKWAQQHVNLQQQLETPVEEEEEEGLLERDEFPNGATDAGNNERQGTPPELLLHGQSSVSSQPHDPMDDQTVLHYPWNSTGFYRGQWTRLASNESVVSSSNEAEEKAAATATATSSTDDITVNASSMLRPPMMLETLDAVSLEVGMLGLAQAHSDSFDVENATAATNTQPSLPPLGVFVLPPGKQLRMRDDHNYTSLRLEQVTVDVSGKTYPPKPLSDEPTEQQSVSSLQQANATTTKTLPLTRDAGRLAFQLFSRKIPALRELSLVDGFIKLYDAETPGYSTRKDVLLRVRGVMIHGIGRLSLVANVNVQRSALVIGYNQSVVSAIHVQQSTNTNDALNTDLHRRLLRALENVDEADLHQVRDDAEALFRQQPLNDQKRATQWQWTSPEWPQRSRRRRLEEQQQESLESDNVLDAADAKNASLADNITVPLPIWSDIVLPFPFTYDDQHESIRKTRTPGARRMPPREQLLEDNALDCEFEIVLNVQEVEWTVGAWRNLMLRRLKEAKLLNPFLPIQEGASDKTGKSSSRSPSLSARERAKLLQDQAVVMSMLGKIESRNCHFSASLNVTAIRTDWDATTSKAINYSFYMMLVCLTQILILLRQLLYSQTQSAAVKVSLLCIGWQTVIDALVCLAHIYLSLAMQPLFAAFASVAFFKLLIFCVIEMKYMAMIIQARNNSTGGGQTQEALRRQVTVLHVRFYITLFVAFFLAFYVGEKYRTFYALLLYSFWVPQIVLNVITETKKPLHKYYVYGMSLTRLVAPLYIFCLPNNFLKEVYPDSPTDPVMCELLIAWVGIQTAVLMAQGKYGARFMIPARFLPPKFDYSRPLPVSMLPPPLPETPTAELIDEDHRGSSPASLDKNDQVGHSSDNTLPSRTRHSTALTNRNRTRGLRRPEGSNTMTTETVTHPASQAQFTLDCSICYEAIDTRNPRGYMLAPCNHLFHRDCLIQWMDVKLECPICRTNLPAL